MLSAQSMPEGSAPRSLRFDDHELADELDLVEYDGG
jgi:hypothetical protein